MTNRRTGHIRITADPFVVEAVLSALRANPSLSIARVSKTYPEADGRQRLYVRVR